MALLWALRMAPTSTDATWEDLRDRLVLIALAADADNEGEMTRPNLAQVADTAGVELDDVVLALRSLAGSGLLSLALMPSGGPAWIRLALQRSRPGAVLFGVSR